VSAGWRRGVRLGLDVGSVRVGVARTDPDGLLAVPVTTVTRPKAVAAADSDLAEIADLVLEHEPIEIVVGLPLGLDGREGAAAAAARAYADALADVLAGRGLEVALRLVDERLSTVEATRGMRDAGRNSREGRSVVDQAAAVIIVQHAVDAEKATGTPPGTVIEPRRDPA
jgi:putative Holliday junction resolvase